MLRRLSDGVTVQRLRPGMFAAAVLLAIAAMCLGRVGTANAADVTPFSVPQPSVSAEIPSTATDFPFGAYGFQEQFPLPKGYEVHEYFFSGEAKIYEFTPTGIRVVGPCPASVTGTEMPKCSGLPYTTRMVVMAPKKRSSFSGNVWVNPFNPSVNYDLNEVWTRQLDYHGRKGDIMVGWTSKSVSVDFLKQFAPERYGALHWPYNPATPGSNHAPYDGILFDVASQIGALFQKNGKNSPIRNYKVERVFETGYSQDGGFTFTQASVFHRLARMPNGDRVYDGYLPQGSGGPSNINLGLTANGVLPEDSPRIKMGPRDAPVIKLNTEAELALYGITLATRKGWPVNWRRADSDKSNDRYREWEVPGASHSDAWDAVEPSNLTLYGVPSFEFPCDHSVDTPTNISPLDMPFGYVANAAAEALVDWVDRGRAPARFARIQQTDLAVPTLASIRRDEFGNALGGVRTPYLEVPHSTYHTVDTGASWCWGAGWRTPLDQTTLDRLYDSNQDYVRKFRKSARDAVKAGAWLRADARTAINGARQADVP